MPPVAAAAGIASAIGGAVINSRAQGRALKSQEKSNADALGFAKDNEARRRFEYDQAQAAARQRYDAYNRRRISLLRGIGMYDGPDPVDSPAPAPYQPSMPPTSGFQNPGGAMPQAAPSRATAARPMQPLTPVPMPTAAPTMPGARQAPMPLDDYSQRRNPYAVR